MYLLLLAVAPAVVLLHYVWKKDKSEKEPPSLLIGLFFAGVAACIPASIIENILITPLQSIFGVTAGSGGGILYNLIENFLCVALVEEGLKFLAMYLITRNNKNFNSLFDGMIYAIFVSLGFAAFENVFYVFEYGLSTALVRTVTAVPGHMFFAVFMGYYYSMWHIYKTADTVETNLARYGYIIKRGTPFEYQKHLGCSILIPVLVHGFYDFGLSVDSALLSLAVLVLMVVLYIVCFNRIKRMSQADMEDYKLVPMLVCTKYPEMIGVIMPYERVPSFESITHEQAVEMAARKNAEEQARQMQYAAQQYQQNPYYQPPTNNNH